MNGAIHSLLQVILNFNFLYTCLAEKEATNLVKKRNSLGDHESFKTWSEGNEHFTEIAVKINSFGRIKSKKIFAMVCFIFFNKIIGSVISNS